MTSYDDLMDTIDALANRAIYCAGMVAASVGEEKMEQAGRLGHTLSKYRVMVDRAEKLYPDGCCYVRVEDLVALTASIIVGA